jgi:hypothetical protein
VVPAFEDALRVPPPLRGRQGLFDLGGSGAKPSPLGREEGSNEDLLLAAFVAAAVVVAMPAQAHAPIRVTLTFEDVTFTDPYLTDACGTTVLNTVNMTLTATVDLVSA